MIAVAFVATLAMAVAGTSLLHTRLRVSTDARGLPEVVTPPSSESGPKSLDPDRVVVATFENRTGDPALDPIGQMVADWLVQGLVRTELLQVVPPTTSVFASRFHRARAEEDPSVDPVRAIARETGAGLVIEGAYYLDGDTLHLQPRINDVVEGALVGAPPVAEGSVSRPLELVEDVRSRVLGTLAAARDPRFEAGPITGPGRFPRYEAYVAFAEGMAAFVERDFAPAMSHMMRAASLDTTYATPLVWASFGAWFGGNDERSASLAAEAEARSGLLLPSDRLFVEWARALAASGFDRVLDVFRRGFESTGGSLWRYLFGIALQARNRPRQAVEVFEGLDPAGSLMSGWVQYWQWPAHGYHMLGDHEAELAKARQARIQYPRSMRAASYEAEARAVIERLRPLERHPVSGASQPRREAGIEALLGREEQALALLRQALANGVMYEIWLHREPEYAPLRDHPGFQALLEPAG